jgi:hypothetical protein
MIEASVVAVRLHDGLRTSGGVTVLHSLSGDERPDSKKRKGYESCKRIERVL